MDKDYNVRKVFDLNRKAHIFADSVIYVESTCIPRKCNFLLILLLEWKWKQLQGKILLRRVNWQKRYTNCKWRMTNFNVILLSSQQREAKQKCTLCYLYAFFLESLNMGILRKRKKGKNQNEKISSHQYVHFHIIVFNGNLFFFEMFFEIYSDYRLLFCYYCFEHKILL